MEIIYNNTAYELLFYDVENSWVAQKSINLNNSDLSFEIPLKYFYQDLNWVLVPDFLSFLETNLINGLNDKLKALLFEIAEKSGWFIFNESTFQFRYELIGVEYKEPILPIHSFEKIQYNYSLVYGLFHPDYKENFDPYAMYFVDLRGNSIMGFRKEN